ncbi:MAG: hypothetical protein Q7R92_03270 [bacterium]|nr:hypothetical protein [bacterium]
MKKSISVVLVVFILWLAVQAVYADESGMEEVYISVIQRQLKESYGLLDSISGFSSDLRLIVSLLLEQPGTDLMRKDSLKQISGQIGSLELKGQKQTAYLNHMLMIFETDSKKSLRLPELKEIMATLSDINNNYLDHLKKLNNYFENLNPYSQIFAEYLLTNITHYLGIINVSKIYLENSRGQINALRATASLSPEDKKRLAELEDNVRHGLKRAADTFNDLYAVSKKLQQAKDDRAPIHIRKMLAWYANLTASVPDIITDHNNANRDHDALLMRGKYK